jgi:phage portal protein BeeE
MALFEKKVTKAAISPAPDVSAAVGYGGSNMIGDFWAYQQGEARAKAMQVATISRARDLIAGVISSMPLKMYAEKWNEENGEMEEVPLAPRSWLRQPDPTVTYPFLMAWTFDDLFHYGKAYWFISARTQDGFPSAFTRIPAGSVTTPDVPGSIPFGPSKQIFFAGEYLDSNDVVQFLSPIEGIVYNGQQTIATALKIEDARARNASSAIPAGILKQTGGEPLSGQELADLAAQFNSARSTNQTAALNEFLSYEATTASPDKMLLIESANYSALEAARLCSVPPYLVGVSTGAYSYQSSEQARADLFIFGVQAFAQTLSATLSMNNVLPRGTYVKFDTDDFLIENEIADTMDKPQPMGQPQNQPEENTQEALAE